ncbi:MULTISPECIES: pyridoxamine 5'-phosphate oxidase family protein [Rhodopseudomonas]|uniref:Pyridoxamine 5-phosphate oxidase n=1 Tax=Rhodopseudomonas palustris TaxID=1076 RepID=A0A0D7EWA0_RHOPL|nr:MULTISPECIES: pyridoxamine 5'-phosphate oxidase family protein [Rhodopseudomonas]KIZ43697.1 pyridoxamine 5-phosphate oxidase [Rhodopseudomonas palustris]MDF3811917.1 pyridoxamine 5'-phosphate oxidase family protein [Rhodopseudomonas sp. BAL398]WOK16681.1 pyridoxamine 5'-phosphate oxidase family protein [Rhodopseudomonas sp. BAL398]
MAYGFLDTLSTRGVRAAQAANGSAEMWQKFSGHRAFDRFTAAETAFVQARDSFYMATVSESGWPYIQHRGGPVGFLKVLDEKTLAFADFRGNRQYISLGNVASDDRAALFLMDYPNRQRLKILAHMSVRDLAAEPEFAEQLSSPGYKGRPERAFILKLEAFDWNCPQHITPRFTADEVAAGTLLLRERLAETEAQLKILREHVARPQNPESAP